MMLKLKSLIKKCIKNKSQISARHVVGVRAIIILPADNKTSITHEMRDRIYSTLEKYDFIKRLNGYELYYIRITNQIPAGIPIIQAYNHYKEPYFSQTETPFGLPRNESDFLCPNDVWLVRIECINKYTTSYRAGGWGFDGYVLQILMNSANLQILDARGEKSL